jgi:hypothetical protein
LKSTFSRLTVAAMTVGLLFALAGCTKSADEPVADNPALAAPVPPGMVRGTVLETMNSGGYTYVFMDTGQGQRWVAARVTPVQVGDIVQTDQGMPMADFESKTLNRTFEAIYFVAGLQNLSSPVAAEAPMPAGQPSTETAEIEVEALEPGQNIANVYANKDAMAGQQVSLRGKVVKYNSNILGWNFIHVQDGSGDAADGSNDLTVTSKSETAVGETVVLTGTIVLDKDFGAGYSFPLLLEDASITTEM